MHRCVIALVAILWTSCEVKPKEIAYGQDACHFCKMTIVDRQHSAQLVTVKGKAFKYDAIECMMNDLSKWDSPPVKYFLAADYTHPGNLVDATNAYYLIAEAISSPMGESLTAFADREERNKIKTELDGRLLSWVQLQKEFDVNEKN